MNEAALLRRALRRAIANYMHSEGCACCQNIDAHKKHAAELAKLLRVPKYPDGSGYNFGKFRAVDNSGVRK